MFLTRATETEVEFPIDMTVRIDVLTARTLRTFDIPYPLEIGLSRVVSLGSVMGTFTIFADDALVGDLSGFVAANDIDFEDDPRIIQIGFADDGTNVESRKGIVVTETVNIITRASGSASTMLHLFAKPRLDLVPLETLFSFGDINQVGGDQRNDAVGGSPWFQAGDRRQVG